MRSGTYKDLIVWQRSAAMVADIYRLTAALPPDERFGLVAQLRRAAVSVCANIAEGNGRATRGEYLNCLSVARGSLNEVRALWDITALLGFVRGAEVEQLEEKLEAVSKMLSRLFASLASRRTAVS